MKEINIIPRPNDITVKSEQTVFVPFSVKIKNDFSESFEIPEGFFDYDSGSDFAISLIKNEALSNEEYILEIEDGKIDISASGFAGAFYGVQSLYQLFLNGRSGEGYILPNCLICDKPRFKHRGFMLDEARHFFGKAFVKRLLNVMASLKMNVFHWHLTDDQGWRIEIKKYPELAEKGSVRKSTQLDVLNIKTDNNEYGKGCFYTREDIKEIVSYAKKLNIDIIPEIDLPGHLSAAIACYPELSCEKKEADVGTRWGIIKNVGCCGNDFLYEFSKNVLSEMCDMFPYEYFHIGGDETPTVKWKSCPDCQKKMKENGMTAERELQTHFTNYINAFLKSKNKKAVAWNDILSSSNVDDDVKIQWWIKDIKSSGAEKWLEKGNTVILSRLEYFYFDHCYARKDLRKAYSLDLKPLGVSEKYENQIAGIEAPLWTEYVRNEKKFSFNAFPRIQAVAEIGWTDRQNRDFDDFMKRLDSFEAILNKNEFKSAPKKAYLLSGIGGFVRKMTEQVKWLFNPNFEFEKYAD